MTWDVTSVGEGTCKVVLTHNGFMGDTATAQAVADGWPDALSWIKTLVETGTLFQGPARRVM